MSHRHGESDVKRRARASRSSTISSLRGVDKPLTHVDEYSTNVLICGQLPNVAGLTPRRASVLADTPQELGGRSLTRPSGSAFQATADFLHRGIDASRPPTSTRLGAPLLVKASMTQCTRLMSPAIGAWARFGLDAHPATAPIRFDVGAGGEDRLDAATDAVEDLVHDLHDDPMTLDE